MDEKPTGSLTVDQALDMFEEYKTYWEENYKEARTDLNFYLGFDHWEAADVETRKKAGKACLVINELPQFVHQVTNDIRQNVPSIKVLPVSDGDIETGDIFSGLFRAIEDHSHADEVVDTAAEYAVKCGIGFMRIDHDYCYDDNDEQEVLFKTVADPLSCWIDPGSVEYDGRDANGFIALQPISKASFTKQYPKAKFLSFTDPKNEGQQESIVLGEIFVREQVGARGKKYIVHRYLFSGDAQLAYTTFPGDYIPGVPIYGEVTWVNGKRIVSSLIRQARDPQKRLNHWASKEAEILSMAPIAPVMAAQGTLVNDRGQWQKPGSEMVLEYQLKDINGDPAPAPSRLQPPTIPTGIINAMQGAKDNIKESMGLYNASIGQKSNEVSGVAIDARKTEGDVATFHFADNVRRSYGHMGEIAVCMFPVVYDTARVLQTMNDEMDVQMVGVNGAPMQEGQDRPYDLTKGKYRVRVTTGASYTTKRQQEAQFLTTLAQKDPQIMQIGGDIVLKSIDQPGAQALAARYKKTIPPQLLDDKDQPQETPQEAQMKQVIQQGAQEIQKLQGAVQQLQQELQSKQQEFQLKAAELQIKSREVDIKQQDAQTKAYTAQKPDAVATPPDDTNLQIELLKLQQQKAKDDQDYDIKQKQYLLEVEELKFQILEGLKETPKPGMPGELQPGSGSGASHESDPGIQAIVSQLDMLIASVNQPRKPIQILRADPNDPTSPIIGAQ